MPTDRVQLPARMRLTIAVKSAMTFALLIVFSLALVGLYLERQERDAVIAQTVIRLEALTSLLSSEVPDGVRLGDAWAQQAAARTRARVTLIVSDGRVLADSDEPSARMENHLDRPEVMAALQTGRGQATRFSRSVHRDLFYYAQEVATTGGPVVLRLSVPLGDVASGFTRFRRDFLAIAVLSFALASTAAILWGRGIARHLRRMVLFARSVSQGEIPSRLPATSGDELADLAAALNAMAEDIQGMLHQLEEEGRRFRTIVENMAEGLLVLDRHNRISFVNSAAEQLLNLRQEAVLGHTPLEVVRSHELDDLLREAGRKEGGASAEITLVHPRRRILAGTAAAMRDAQGIVEGIILAFRDVTQLKRLEEMRMEFVLNVSHELRTPLTAIRGYAETLLHDGLENREHALKFLEVIHRHSERLGHLLDDLLELSDIELERTPLLLRSVPVVEAARQVFTLLASQAEKKRICLTIAVPDDVPPVLADRDRLVQILVNLVDNAIKYTPEGGDVTLSARRATGPTQSGTAYQPDACGPSVEIAVVDTGIGIPQKDLPRLTERFYRVDKARSRELGGTGLGLAIVKHLVAAHRGTLSVQSRLGEGTEVRITLAAASSAPSPSA